MSTFYQLNLCTFHIQSNDKGPEMLDGPLVETVAISQNDLLRNIR